MKKSLIALCLTLAISCQKEKLSNEPEKIDPLYNKAAKLYLNQPDSSYSLFSKITSTYKDSTLIAKSYFYMAIIQCDQGDYTGAEEMAVNAIRYSKPGSDYLSGLYNTIAIAKAGLNDFRGATAWYRKAINLCVDTPKCLMHKNNLAVSLSEQKRYPEAISILKSLVNNSLVQQDQELFSKCLDNYAWTKWLQNPKYNAAPEYLRAMQIRKINDDLWGQNASLAHLSDYFQEKDSSLALKYAQDMLIISKKINSPDDQLEALQKLINLAPATDSKLYFKNYQQINDSLKTARNAAKNQFALIRFDVEKQKADNMLLQKENSAKNYQLLQLGLGAIGLGIFGIFWYRKRKQTLAFEADKTIQENRLKTSKKVHDVVANGLYRVMTEIENQPEIDKESILDKIEDMYEKSRDISYDKSVLTPPTNLFHEQIGKMLQTFNSSSTTVILHGNHSAFWKDIPLAAKQELEPVLQELMVNMKKHSKANIVELTFSRTTNEAKIKYQDNGIGFPDKVNFNNGLTSTGTRIENISGNITFENVDHAGLEIQISFPIH